MQSRYISHADSPCTDLATAKEAILEALLQNVELVHKYHDSTPSDDSVYVGFSGIGMMYEYLSDLSLPELSSHLVDRSDKYLHLALSSSPNTLVSPHVASKTGFLDTSTGLATLILLRALKNPQSPSEHRSNRAEARALLDAVPTSFDVLNFALRLAVAPQRKASDDGCEVLYGRAGFLYALLRLRSALDRKSSDSIADPSIITNLQALVADAVLSQLVDAIIQRGKNGSATYAAKLASAGVPVSASPLMWSWHEKLYLGGAHGVVGILQTILSCPANIIEAHIPIILNCVEWLLSCQDAGGNWPNAAPTSSAAQRNSLLHWCHGAPAFLILFSTLLRLSASPSHPLTLPSALHDKLVISMRGAANLLYKKGLLRKGVGLCHGVGGSVYALLAVSETLDSSDDLNQAHPYLLRATELAHLVTTYQSLTESGEMRTPDCPWSLYEGVAGMCCAWGAVLHTLGAKDRGNHGIGIPGYTDINML